MKFEDIKVDKECDVCHGHSPYIIVAISDDLHDRLSRRQDGKHALGTYKDKISNSEAGQMQVLSLISDWKGTKSVLQSKITSPLISPSIPGK